jgi:hypothetical protein
LPDLGGAGPKLLREGLQLLFLLAKFFPQEARAQVRDVFDVDDSRAQRLVQRTDGQYDVAPAVGDDTIGEADAQEIAFEKLSEFFSCVPL